MYKRHLLSWSVDVGGKQKQCERERKGVGTREVCKGSF
jgi:hypothetical protein